MSVIPYQLNFGYFFNRPNSNCLISARREERMKMTMSQVVESVSKKKIPNHVRSLVFEICCDDENGQDVEVPFVQYKLKAK